MLETKTIETDKKNKAIKLIMKGLSIQWLPLITIVVLSKAKIIPDKSPLLGVLAFIVLGLLIYGYFPFVKGCSRYIQSKGYSPSWGIVGLLSFVGLFLLSAITPKNTVISSEDLSEEQSTTTPFEKINLVEIFLFYSIGLLYTMVICAMPLFKLNNWDYTGFFNETSGQRTIFSAFYIFLWLLLVIRDLKIADFKLKDFIPNLKISWRIITEIAIIYTTFSISLGRLIYYSFSLILPDHMEKIINQYNPQDFGMFLLDFLIDILITYPFHIFLFQGILLQKISLKVGNKKAILVILLIFFILWLPTFKPNFLVSLFYILILSILLFKTANLLDIFVFGAITTLMSNMLWFIFYAQNFNFPYLSILEYRKINEPFLVLYSILGVISCIFLVKFIRNNFPKENDKIPYLKNREKLLSQQF
ncbi:MAG: hypothetical protein GPI90_23445 [Microcystis aeruginosa K13-05]|jgi:hypothetical protein|nr:hypothetical protein [Microcystis sp. LE19-59.1C]MCZ8046171.1 hypothetical protein [Microcystis sp. LE19-41.2A]NCR63983.1 hypothetical protein [Microcystis aeruginosa LG11-05]NCR87377.1 hypothetical protein [Microcystis aeruginosa K13-05]